MFHSLQTPSNMTAYFRRDCSACSNSYLELIADVVKELLLFGLFPPLASISKKGTGIRMFKTENS